MGYEVLLLITTSNNQSYYHLKITSGTMILTPNPVCGVFFSTDKQFSDPDWESCDSPQFWHNPPGAIIRSHRVKTESYEPHPPSPLRTTIWPTCYVYVGGFHDLLLRFDELARVAQRTQRNILHLRSPLITKGASRTSLSTPFSPSVHGLTNQKLSEPCPFGFL